MCNICYTKSLYCIFLQKCKTNLNFWEKFVWTTLTISDMGGGGKGACFCCVPTAMLDLTHD